MFDPIFLESHQQTLLEQLVETDRRAGRNQTFAMLIYRGDGKIETVIMPMGVPDRTIDSVGTDDTSNVQELENAGLVSVIRREQDKWEFTVTNKGRRYYDERQRYAVKPGGEARDSLLDMQQRRDQFLRLVHEKTRNPRHPDANIFTVGEELGFTKDETLAVDQYLTRAGLLEPGAIAEVHLSHAGEQLIESWHLKELHGVSSEAQSSGDSIAVPIPHSVRGGLARFKTEYPDSRRTAFIIMSFSTSPAHMRIAAAIKETLTRRGIIGLRADDRRYEDDTFPNIATFMYGCGFGVAVFERIEREQQSPNVALEVGYMRALGKRVCLLKDKNLDRMPSDLLGSLYDPFDPQDPEKTIESALGRWLADGGLGQ
jgi:hypothetical protein